jgi:hypothetical protein
MIEIVKIRLYIVNGVAYSVEVCRKLLSLVNIHVTYRKKIWKQSDPSEALTTKYYKRIADSVWLSLYMRDNEYVQHPSRPLAPA